MQRTTCLRVQAFERNTAGRDFVVGDIHGCFGRLSARLGELGFCQQTDRLFSVGDLIDRGPSSHEVLDWIDEPWFFPVCGNHERMAIGAVSGRVDRELYVQNGGGWFFELPESRRVTIAEILSTLPLAIEVDHPSGKVAIVHADVVGMDWPTFKAVIADAAAGRIGGEAVNTLIAGTVWSRDRINQVSLAGVPGVDWLVTGHTPARSPFALGNVVDIDTGAYATGDLTVLDMSALPNVERIRAN